MNSREIELVQTSFAKVAPVAEKAADMFYNRLFELDPSLRDLLQTDMAEQGKRLMAMISVVVEGLKNLDDLVPAIEELGRRHSGYGVEPEHYATVGAALLDILARALGPSFTPDVRDAWLAVYQVLSSTMIGAAEAINQRSVA
jgi:hemoglobin-like flavoprotein